MASFLNPLALLILGVLLPTFLSATALSAASVFPFNLHPFLIKSSVMTSSAGSELSEYPAQGGDPAMPRNSYPRRSEGTSAR